MPNGIHLLLREATRRQHEELHELIDLDLMLKSRRSYSSALQSYFSAISIPESTVAKLCKVQSAISLPDQVARLHKSKWLQSDLSVLGCSVELSDSVDEVWSTHDRRDATIVGFSYVLEGMTLGATKMLPLVREKLGLKADSGARFFHGYGLETGSMWQQFRNWLPTLSVQEDKVIDAAVYCFSKFQAAFTEWKDSYSDPSKGLTLHV